MPETTTAATTTDLRPLWADARRRQPQASVPSPCISVCRLDDAGHGCVGCQRSLAEIREWSRMDDAAKRAIWARIDPASAEAA